MRPNQTSKFLHSKGNPKQNEKTTHRMGENLCEGCYRQGPNLRNIQTTHTTQQKHNPSEKWAEDLDISPKKTSRWLAGM